MVLPKGGAARAEEATLKFKTLVVPATALSMMFTSTMASASGTIATSAGAVSTCASGAAVAASAAAAVQVARPGCVLPAVDAAAPLPVEGGTVVAGGSPFLGGLLLPVLGLAALAGILIATRSNSNGSGSVSRG